MDAREQSRRLVAGDALPTWYSAFLCSATVWVTSAAVAALLLLWARRYHPVAVAAVATAVTIATWRHHPRAPRAARPAHGPAVAAVAIALVLLAVAGAYHAEHLLADRDPAAYNVTGRQIARTHQLNPAYPSSPFDDTRAFATKFEDHHAPPNFLAFLPALLALGFSAGGVGGMLVVPAVLAALGMLALYALASLLVGPRWALLPPAVLVAAPLQSWFARDAYSELPVQLLALAGIWLLLDALRSPSRSRAALAGFVLGAATFARADALALLVAVPAALAVLHLRAGGSGRDDRRHRHGVLWSFTPAGAATVGAGLLVSHALSAGYLEDLGAKLAELLLAFAAGIVAAVAIVAVHRVRPGAGRRVARSRATPWVVAAAVVALATYGYALRPRSGRPPVVGGAGAQQRATRHAFDAFYYSSSLRWFAWYLGIAALALAVAGVVVLGLRALRGGTRATLLLAAAGPVTLLYLARPSVSPDQLWAMRRFLPMTLPLVAIAAVVAVAAAAETTARRRPSLRAPVALLGVALLLGPALYSGAPFVRARMQAGARRAVHDVCRATGADAAIAVAPYGGLGAELPATLRAFCGVPSAAMLTGATPPLTGYATAWRAVGRVLYVVTAARRPVLARAPGAVEIGHIVVADEREPERTLTRAPRHDAPRRVEMWLYRIAPA